MITLGNSKLSLMHIEKIILANEKIEIEERALKKIERCYHLIKSKAKSEIPLYGINTGFGALAEQRINEADQKMLQRNIILSHAVGVGDPLKPHEARAMMLLRLNTLAQGYSGASPDLVNMLLQLIKANVAPFVPQKGSVGASGDLAPLAHLGLLLLGVGQAFIAQKLVSAEEALEKSGLKPLDFGLRDGLALINGTQAMAAKGMMALSEIKALLNLADIAAASCLDAVGGHMAPFDPRIQTIKAHPGQIKTAQNIRALCAGRKVELLIKNPRTQDPYSLRCIPQVHGASKDAFFQMTEVIEREINGVTDNPLIFIDDHEDISIISGGNFHGQSLALALDYLAMAVAELADISERRIEQLVNPGFSNGLPPFLAANSGINSGYMMLHVTASALVNENKVLCHPASIDNIPTSANREDHVSMGMTAANKLSLVIENVRTVLAIELMAAHQALDFRAPHCAGTKVESIRQALRTLVPFRDCDGLYYEDLRKVLRWIQVPQTLEFFDKVLNA
jgi:histidine ammonia-lyase